MAVRIAVGILGGFLLLLLLLKSFPLALTVVALLHAEAISEYARLDPRLSRVMVALYMVLGTLLLIVLSMALVKALPAELALALIPLVVLPLVVAELVSYERGGEAGHNWFLLRALLLITLPLAFVAPIAAWPGRFPWLLLLLGASFACDGASMLAGMALGRRKLAPRLSPHKTWEGLVGGLLAAAATWGTAVALYPLPGGVGMPGRAMAAVVALPLPGQVAVAAVAGMLVALAGVIGGLAFSLLKRQAGVKDWAHIIPGHGGVLDRFDAFMFCAPLVYLLCLS